MRRVRLFSRTALLLILASAGGATTLHAQPAPLGSEFQVNTYTTQEQFLPSVAADGLGRFVIVWNSGPSFYTGSYPRPGQDGSETGIFAQRYDNTGVPLGSEFQVNVFTTAYQQSPDVAADGDGGLVVVWESSGQAHPRTSIFGRRYSSSGIALGGEFQVNTSTTFSRSRPAVASNAGGDFVVAWEGSVEEIFARRYDSTGTPVGDELQVNTITAGIHSAPDVAINDAGQFVVSWIRLYASPGASVASPVARLFDESGPVGGEIQVSSYADPLAVDAAVAMDGSGDFVIVWNNIATGGSGPGPAMLGRRFDSTGAALGSDFVVNGHGGNLYSRVGVAMDATSSFIVVWETLDTSDLGVAVRQYDSTGAPTGGPLQVNNYAVGDQVWPAVAAAPSGDFVVTWTSSTLFRPGEDSPDGSGSGVFARQFLAEGPPALLEAGVRITPRRLNAKSKGRWVNLKVSLPAGFGAGDVDPATVGITNLDGPGCPGPYVQGVDPDFGIRPSGKGNASAKKLTAKLDRRTLIDAACIGEVGITVGGEMLTGELFSGSDVIEIFMPGRGKGGGGSSKDGGDRGRGGGRGGDHAP